MKFSLISLFAAATTAAAWNVTGYTDSECTQEAGVSYGISGSIGCLLLNKPVQALRVENLPDDMIFRGGSNTGCGMFSISGGNGCHFNGHDFQSFTIFSTWYVYWMIVLNCMKILTYRF